MKRTVLVTTKNEVGNGQTVSAFIVDDKQLNTFIAKKAAMDGYIRHSIS